MNKLLAASALFTVAYITPGNTTPIYANAFSGHNISVIQHSIFNMAHNGFDNISSHVGTLSASRPGTVQQPQQAPRTDYKKLYGTMPMYGSMSMYGEYGDDGTVFAPGRSGGDTPRPMTAWISWQHFGDHDKFNNIRTLKTDTDLAMIGVGAAHTRIGLGDATFGGFGGYVGGDQTNNAFDVTQRGGYVGGYGAYRIGHFSAAGDITLGKLYNDISKEFGGTDFNNTWLAAGMNAAYDVLLDSTFALQPSLYAGYTFVISPDFTIPNDIKVKNDNLHAFEITPGLRAIKHIGGGWVGAIGAKYVIRLDAGGTVHVANEKLSDLSTDNFAEYGVSLEKSFGAFSAIASFNRRDGGRAGWNGGLNLKYVF